jgi:malonyl-CoA decarboxylase
MGRIWMSQMVEAIADLGLPFFDRHARLPPVEAALRLCRDLLSDHGEASGTALAREVIALYDAFQPEDRVEFIERLAVDFAPDHAKLREAAEAWLGKPDQANYLSLARAVDSPRLELLRRINMAPGATGVLVGMRETLLNLLPEKPELKTLDADFRHLFESWFNRGFLQFERIDWRTAAVVLEKLIAYEAVHEIRGWGDLRRRLAEDRRCFAFFHPALADEPLIFVEVALTRGIAEQIQPLLDNPPQTLDAVKPDTAIFYSISNCQAGLAGISFGNFLIKQVVDALQHELPGITQFSTLSPMPGFCRWVAGITADGAEDVPDWLEDNDRASLSAPDWQIDETARTAKQKTVMKLAAHYLARASRNGRPVDPVARFHLGNGALIEQINWAGDLSEKGLRQSAGVMVNYRYDPASIVANHEAFVAEGKIATSSKVRGLLGSRR